MANLDLATLVRAKWGEEFDQPDDAYQFTARTFKDSGVRGGIYVLSTTSAVGDRVMNAGNTGAAQEGYAITGINVDAHKGKAIAAALNADLYTVPPMSGLEADTLLRAWAAGNLASSDREQINIITNKSNFIRRA